MNSKRTIKPLNTALLLIFILAAILFLFSCSACKSNPNTVFIIEVPPSEQVKLKPVGKLDKKIHECSGLARSSRIDGLYWAHSDSSDNPSIYPFFLNSSDEERNSKIEAEIDLENKHNATDIDNRDWEDITTDYNGHLIIGDVGNNNGEDLVFTIYIIDEPAPFKKKPETNIRKFFFSYPDFANGEAAENFDCEALFWFGEKLYLLTKHHNNTGTNLYRFDALEENKTVYPKKIAGFSAGGQVTAAEVSKSGRTLAILTYTNVWVFTNFKGDNFFSGTAYYLPIDAKQCEAITFISEDELIICNEQRDIFRLKLSNMIKTDGASHFLSD
jgi:hypothetical protein